MPHNVTPATWGWRRASLLNLDPQDEETRRTPPLTRAADEELALEGQLDEDKVDYQTHPIFNLRVPTSCPDVPAEILNPRDTWEDKAAYDAQAEKLRQMFRDNYEAKGLGELGIPAVM